MGSRFGSPVLVVKPKPNRTGKIFGFSNRFNRFFISVRFSRLIFHRFSRFFRLFGFFEHPYEGDVAGHKAGCLQGRLPFNTCEVMGSRF
jgi:hypothetical protein